MQAGEGHFEVYPEKDRDWLILRYSRLAEELCNAYIIYASNQQQEKSARINGFLRSEATTVTGKERDADVQAMPLTLGLYELTGQIKAMQEEKALLLLLLGEPDADSPGGTVGDLAGLPTRDQGSGYPGEHRPNPG